MSAVAVASAALREAIELVRSPRLLEEGANVQTLFSASMHKRTEAFEALREAGGWARGSDAAHLLDRFVEKIVPPMLTDAGDAVLVELLRTDAVEQAVRHVQDAVALPAEYANIAMDGLLAPFTWLRAYRL